MDITQTIDSGVVQLVVHGRLDGYWADHLNAALADAVRQGHHQIRVDCAGLTFLSSAGIAVLVKYQRELARINGAFRIVNPSTPVSTVLRMTRLLDVLVGSGTAAAVSAGPVPLPARSVERDGLHLEIFELDAGASLRCRTVGSPAALAAGAFTEADCTSLGDLAPTLAVGLGAFGDSFAECRTRFGEMLSVGGATAYQPADGTNVADFLVAAGPLASDVRVLYCLAAEGSFSRLIRFEADPARGTVGLSALLAGCLAEAGAPAAGLVVVAEAAGLVGAALRHSPADRADNEDFFAHPGVRTRLMFTAEPAYPKSVMLAAGVVANAEGTVDGSIDQLLRPFGDGTRGHLHAAAFRFRPIQKGRIDVGPTVSNLFESEQLLGVLHLLHDDRSVSGAGETELIRGGCWIAPLSSGVAAPSPDRGR